MMLRGRVNDVSAASDRHVPQTKDLQIQRNQRSALRGLKLASTHDHLLRSAIVRERTIVENSLSNTYSVQTAHYAV